MFSIRQRFNFLYSVVSDSIPLDIIGYVGTIFWIGGTFGPLAVDPTKAPYLGDYTGFISPGNVSALFISAALATHVALPLIYTVYAGPFDIRIDWYPLSTDSKVHRAKKRGELRLESGGQLQIVLPVETVEAAKRYELWFDPTSPIEIDMWDEPNDDQDWDRERNVLSSNNVVHNTFTPVFTIEATDDLGTGGNHHIQVVNKGRLRQRTVLKIPIVE